MADTRAKCTRCGGPIGEPDGITGIGYGAHAPESGCIEFLKAENAQLRARIASLTTVSDEDAALDMAWRVVDALGGTYDKTDPGECAYSTALNDACAEIEKLGGMDPAERRRRHAIA